MLEYLNPAVRHALIALAASLLSWGAIQVSALPVPLALLAGTAITIATAYLTPLTRQYGIGIDKLPEVDDYWNDAK